jgi:hypothetical protein
MSFPSPNTENGQLVQEVAYSTIMQEVLPIAHRLTFLSSPPVTRTRPDLAPRDRQLTLAPWAENSSAIKKKKYNSFFAITTITIVTNKMLTGKHRLNKLTQLPSSLACGSHGAS